MLPGDENGLLASGPPVGAYRRRTDLLPTIVTPRERTSTPGRAVSLGRIDQPAAAAAETTTTARRRPQHVSMCNLAARSRTRGSSNPASKPNLHKRAATTADAAIQRGGQRPSAKGKRPEKECGGAVGKQSIQARVRDTVL